MKAYNWCCGKLAPRKPMKQILLIGLDYSGKTTMIKRFHAISSTNEIKQGESELIMTTPFINVETVKWQSDEVIVYDMSGQGRYREGWSFFYPEIDGIMFVVDCSDTDRLTINMEILHELARHPGLARRFIPITILANKADVDGAINGRQLAKAIHLDDLRSINPCLTWSITETVGITGKGVERCFGLLTQNNQI